MKKRIIIITIMFVLLFGANMVMHVFNPFNIDIHPLIIEENRIQSGRRLEISFSYDKLLFVASNQFAFWIEDMDGNYVNTLYLTNYTAQVGHRRRPQSIPEWVLSAQPSNMLQSEIDTISGATPRPGDYFVYWDFTDRKGNLSIGSEYRYFITATMFIDNDLIYSGIIKIGDDSWEYYPSPVYSVPNSEYKSMLTNVRVAFYPN